MPAFPASDGMPVRVDLLTPAPKKSERFYRSLLGWSYRNSGEAGGEKRRVAMIEGLPVSAFHAEEDGQPSRWRVSFFVSDLEETVAKARELGAEIIQEPISLIDGGTMAVIQDPTGSLVGLLNLPNHEAMFAAGEPGAPVWFELVADNNFDEAVRFYHELFGWTVDVRHRTETDGYAIAVAEDAAFAGIALAPEGTNPGWISYLGVENIGKAVNLVVDLGGEVVVPVQDTEFGPVATIVDPAGATTILCEVPLPPEEDIHESDPLENIDLSQFRM